MIPLVLLATSLLTLEDDRESLPDASAIEQKVLADRRAIICGQIEFHSRIWRFSRGKRLLHYDVRTMIWFDKNSLRSDEFPAYKTGSRHPHREIRSITPEKFIYWSNEKLQDEKTIGVSLISRKSVKDYPTYGVIHPRLVGMSPRAFIRLLKFNNNLDYTIARNDRTPPTVRRTIWKGQKCLLVEYRLSNDVEKKIYYSLERGWAPVFMESIGRRGKVSLECTLAKAGSSGIWYPTACVYQDITDGRVVEEENLEVTVHSMNLPPDAKIFSLEGMNLPNETRIFRFPEEKSGEELIWDGKKITQLNESVPLRDFSTQRKNNNVVKRPLLFLMSCLFAAATVIIFFIRKMKKRA